MKFDTAILDADLYGDLGAFPGTTAHRFSMSGQGTHSDPRAVVTIENRPLGSGTNGPFHADAGLYVSTIKQDWQPGTSVDGEVEGIFVVCRNGVKGDTGGILIDCAGYGTESPYVLEALETQITHQENVGGTILAQLNAQACLAKPGAGVAGRWIGFEAVALTGSKFNGTEETYGYLVTNLNETTSWRAGFAVLGKSTYGLDLSQATITFAAMAIPNDIPIKCADNVGWLCDVVKVNTANSLEVGHATDLSLTLLGSDIKWGKPLVALGGGAAATLGTMGGSGPATAKQDSWMRVIDSAGEAFWVPAWK